MPKNEFLKELLSIPSVSGDEFEFLSKLLHRINQRKSNWKVSPEVFFGEKYHDCILLKFGTPRTAVFAHVMSTL